MSGPGAAGHCTGVISSCSRAVIPTPIHPQLSLGLTLREHARFESYLDSANEEAVSALRDLATARGEQLLVLSGPAGVGKTHLLQAACHAAAERGRTCVYLPVTEIQVLGPAVLADLEQLGLVCLDDVHAIAGLELWEHALFDLFNRLRASGSTLLVALDRMPDRCGFAMPDLVSRLGWGVSYRLRPLPEYQLQDALMQRAAGRGLQLSGDAAQFMLRRLPRDPASLFSALDRLDEASMIEQRRLTIPFIRSVLQLD